MKYVLGQLAMAAGMIAMSLYIMMLLIFAAQIIKYKKSEHKKKIKIEIMIGNAIHFRKEISKIKGLIMTYALAFCLLTLIIETLFVLITRIVDIY
ncbi:hypothetical protein NIE88_10150 [Sporolactobacillus shoreicorticis]|uniref:Uncharacterized protein n=1 Tax=Sporolactobacillus shoreicorticis TaxID=1923877 RepID=A0ABW5SAA7_9BACL|nr:hypothetical protein [Sporolactobacillus shoreicorticis]MCO7126135.1 hypothetical protein [Sporolactobacillus shoreicorticis]